MSTATTSTFEDDVAITDKPARPATTPAPKKKLHPLI